MRIPKVRVLAVVTIVVAILAVALWPSAIEIDVAKVGRGAMQVTIDEGKPAFASGLSSRPRSWDASSGSSSSREIPWFAARPLSRGSRPRLRRSSTFAPRRSSPRRSRRPVPCRPGTGRAAACDRHADARAVDGFPARGSARSGAISGDELEAAQTTLRSAEEAVRAASSRWHEWSTSFSSRARGLGPRGRGWARHGGRTSPTASC